MKHLCSYPVLLCIQNPNQEVDVPQSAEKETIRFRSQYVTDDPPLSSINIEKETPKQLSKLLCLKQLENHTLSKLLCNFVLRSSLSIIRPSVRFISILIAVVYGFPVTLSRSVELFKFVCVTSVLSVVSLGYASPY